MTSLPCSWGKAISTKYSDIYRFPSKVLSLKKNSPLFLDGLKHNCISLEGRELNNDQYFRSMFSWFHMIGIAWEMVIGRILRCSMRVPFFGVCIMFETEELHLRLGVLHSIVDFKKEHCHWWPWPYHVSSEKELSTF